MTRIATVALWLVAALIAGCDSSPRPVFQLTDLTGAEFGRDFQLTDPHGKPRTLADFRGKVVAIFFGFVHCPEVCPTALAELASVANELGKDADRLQVLLITVDPERDTAELLSKYVPAFDPGFIGLYGDAAATARVAKEFKVFYQKVPGRTPESYTVDHTAGSYVLDPQGRLRLFVRHGNAAWLADDLRTLLQISG